ncbi:MAG TPA: DUF1538 domain-containing protein, partial [Gammaproteobacteria bacterium]
GTDLPHQPTRLKLRPADVYQLLGPYTRLRLVEQIRAVVPLAIYLALFQTFILKQEVVDSTVISAGLVAVILGLMMFMEGLKVGLMPFGESIGTSLPAKSSLFMVLSIVFLLGIGVTFAEPAIGALKTAGALVQVERAPYLYALLTDWSEWLVLVVGIGVGFAAVLGTLRFLYGWSLKPLIYLTLIPTIGMTAYIAKDPELSKILGLAWDSGAVTTGPVTVPLVLALGIGIAAAAGKGYSSVSGFGIVTLASLFPILGVEALGLYVASQQSVAEIIGAAALASTAAQASWYEQTPAAEILGGIRAIVPLVLFLVLVMTVILKERIHQQNIIIFGIGLCVVGMIVFNLGLSFGLAKLGSQSGSLVPAAFTQHEGVVASPLYHYVVGMLIAVIFAWLLGFGATLAEPALNALGMTVENLTNGAFRKSTLMYAVSFGVGCGIAVGVIKIVYEIPVAWLLIPGYTIAAVLTSISTEEFVNVAWDSAGVTTGPVTVPLVLAMGLGFGDAVGAVEGFGILSMASIGPIIAVLTTGLWIHWKIKKRHQEEDEAIDGTATVST